MLTLPNIGEHRFFNSPQSKPPLVAGDLPVVWRVPIDEIDRESELIGIEIARCFDLGNEQLCRG
jgi:hypothetical protein